MATILGTPGSDDLSSDIAGDVIQGLEGDDTLAANAADITLDGGAGDDSLFSFAGDSTLIGGPGGDLLFGSGLNDTASYTGASAGAEVDLSAFSASDGDGGSDVLFQISNVTGSAFDDILTGDDLVNVLQGGAGDDTLTGNGGPDVFKYSFNLAQGGGGGETFRFTDWLSEKYGKNFGDELPDYSPRHHGKHDRHHDKHDKHHGKHDGHCGDDDHHAQNAGLTEKFFEKNYEAWLKEVVVADLLEQGFVLDANGNGKIKIDIKENSPNGTPRIEGLTKDQLAEMFGDRDSVILNDHGKADKAWYSNSYTSPGGGQETTVASGDGFDTILDFDFNEDKLELNGLAGLTLDQFANFFSVTEADVNGDAVTDTVLALDDGAWGVTMLGVSGHGIEDFYNSSVFS